MCTCTVSVLIECHRCLRIPDDVVHCNATYSGFNSHIHSLQGYANEQLAKSYDYLLLASNFGTHVKNRPGFEKQFLALSNKAWSNAIDLIKHITKRGGAHSFNARPHTATATDAKKVLELAEMQALALALDSEKALAIEAHNLHEMYSRHRATHTDGPADIHHAGHREYDPEVAHYLEEKFIGEQAETIRKLSGYTNDLKQLIKGVPATQSTALNLYLFDEYLASQ